MGRAGRSIRQRSAAGPVSIEAAKLHARQRALGREPAVVSHNLPLERTTLLGREHDLAAIHAALGETPGRLVTLTGPGARAKAAWQFVSAGS